MHLVLDSFPKWLKIIQNIQLKYYKITTALNFNQSLHKQQCTPKTCSYLTDVLFSKGGFTQLNRVIEKVDKCYGAVVIASKKTLSFCAWHK